MPDLTSAAHPFTALPTWPAVAPVGRGPPTSPACRRRMSSCSTSDRSEADGRRQGQLSPPLPLLLLSMITVALCSNRTSSSSAAWSGKSFSNRRTSPSRNLSSIIFRKDISRAAKRRSPPSRSESRATPSAWSPSSLTLIWRSRTPDPDTRAGNSRPSCLWFREPAAGCGDYLDATTPTPGLGPPWTVPLLRPGPWSHMSGLDRTAQDRWGWGACVGWRRG